MIELDEIDKQIIALLKRDGRMSNREVGRALDVSEGTVRNRLRRMFDAKALQLNAVVAPTAIGRIATAFVRIAAEPSKANAIARLISVDDEVSFLGLTAGRYNLLVTVTVRSREELARYIQDRLALVDGVVFIDTREIVRSVKHRVDRVLVI